MNSLLKYDIRAANAHPENVLDKIKIWYFQQDTELLDHQHRIVLTAGQIEKKDQLIQIWTWLVSNPEEDVILGIQKKWSLGDKQARNLCRQSKDLFGDIKAAERRIQRVLRIDQREQAIKEIKKDKFLSSSEKWELVHKNLERIEKMSGLEKEDELSQSEILEALKMPDIIRSTNPQTLDTDHEEVTEE
jgi:hypothetical protein